MNCAAARRAERTNPTLDLGLRQVRRGLVQPTRQHDGAAARRPERAPARRRAAGSPSSCSEPLAVPTLPRRLAGRGRPGGCTPPGSLAGGALHGAPQRARPRHAPQPGCALLAQRHPLLQRRPRAHLDRLVHALGDVHVGLALVRLGHKVQVPLHDALQAGVPACARRARRSAAAASRGGARRHAGALLGRPQGACCRCLACSRGRSPRSGRVRRRGPGARCRRTGLPGEAAAPGPTCAGRLAAGGTPGGAPGRTGGKAAQQVERGGALVVRLHHAVGVGHARVRGELLAVDDVAPAGAAAGCRPASRQPAPWQPASRQPASRARYFEQIGVQGGCATRRTSLAHNAGRRGTGAPTCTLQTARAHAKQQRRMRQLQTTRGRPRGEQSMLAPAPAAGLLLCFAALGERL